MQIKNEATQTKSHNGSGSKSHSIENLCQEKAEQDQTKQWRAQGCVWSMLVSHNSWDMPQISIHATPVKAVIHAKMAPTKD